MKSVATFGVPKLELNKKIAREGSKGAKKDN